MAGETSITRYKINNYNRKRLVNAGGQLFNLINENNLCYVI